MTFTAMNRQTDRYTPIMSRLRPRPFSYALFSLTAILLLAGTAPGQGLRPPTGNRQAFQPDVQRRDEVVFIEELGLDETQQLQLTAEVDRYVADFTEGRAEVRKAIAAMRPGPRSPAAEYREVQEALRERITALLEQSRADSAATDDPEERRRIMDKVRSDIAELRSELADYGATSGDNAELMAAMAEMQKLTASWLVRKAALHREFLQRVQGMLTEDQTPRWPGLERRLRREKTMHRSSLSGENVDLVRVLGDIQEVAPQSELENTVLAYETRLDRALHARNNFELESAVDRAAAEQASDADQLKAIYARQITLARAVRDVNLEFAPLIAAALAGESGAVFTATVNQRTLPRLYGPNRADRLIRSALAMQDLEDQTLADVKALRQEYDDERVAPRASARQVLLASEPDERITGRRTSDASDAVYAAMRTAEAGAIERLRLLLGDERFLRLPGAGAGRRGGDLEAAGRAMQKRMLEKYDRDGDGRLNAEERKAMQARNPGRDSGNGGME